MIWDVYYKNMYEWSTSTLVRGIDALSDLGSEEEVSDMILHISLDDEDGATKLLKKALGAGMTFSGEHLADMAASCDETVWLRALNASKHRFTTEDLDHLHYNTDNVILVRIAQECGLKLPKDLAEEWAEEQAEEEAFELSQKNYDRKVEIYLLWTQVREALACLQRAENALLWSMSSGSIEHSRERNDRWGAQFWARRKHQQVDRAAVALEEAQMLLQDLDETLRARVGTLRGKISFGNWTRLFDICGSDPWMAFTTGVRIHRAWKEVQELEGLLIQLADSLADEYNQL